MALEKELQKLVETPSISGFERNIGEFIKKELKPHSSVVRIDKIGNVIAKKGKGYPVIMLAAHMDEIGLIVKYIEKEGFVRFDTLGGWDERIMPAQKVRIYGSKGPIIGVIGSKPPHLMEKEEQKQPIKTKELFIDIGAKDQKAAEKLVSVGDFITFHSEFNRMAGNRYTGYGFDNRVGCLVMMEVFKAAKNFKGTLYAVGTIEEELGLVGIRGATFGINPDVMVALDTTIAGDTPGISPHEQPIKMSEGPSIGIKDAIGVTSPRVRKWLTETSKKSKIKFQFEIMSGGATDASVVPMIREGIPSGTLLVPTRYIHSPIEVVDMKDIEATIKLATEAVKSAGKYF